MKCQVCNGKGWHLVPNYELEIMESEQCLDCLAEERDKNTN
tara:strand:+ start:162 stop:284 length:123 start_codon:yes stop_codon:yes gene_type:complete